jgi:hypothetical protein
MNAFLSELCALGELCAIFSWESANAGSSSGSLLTLRTIPPLIWSNPNFHEIDDLPSDLVWLHSGLQKPSRRAARRTQRKEQRRPIDLWLSYFQPF